MKLKLLIPLFAFCMSLFSCSKERLAEVVPAQGEQAAPLAGTAAYRMVVTGTWMQPAHVVPAGNHFTRFIGAVHGREAFLFHIGYPASPGVENVAEVGSDAALINEMNLLLDAGKASSKIFTVLPNITGTMETNIQLTTNHSMVSFLSMIAPSPDWFAGIDSYNLIQAGKWVNDITVPVYGFDAGTEDGDVFSYNNAATSPQGSVLSLTPLNASVIANGNSLIAPFASVRFIKQP